MSEWAVNFSGKKNTVPLLWPYLHDFLHFIGHKRSLIPMTDLHQRGISIYPIEKFWFKKKKTHGSYSKTNLCNKTAFFYFSKKSSDNMYMVIYFQFLNFTDFQTCFENVSRTFWRHFTYFFFAICFITVIDLHKQNVFNLAGKKKFHGSI